MLDHLALQCADVAASAAFYDTVLPALRGKRLMDFGSDIGFGAGEFHRLAVQAGAEVLHEPAEWPQYHPGYYAAFVRDPDGNNVEAICHRPE